MDLAPDQTEVTLTYTQKWTTISILPTLGYEIVQGTSTGPNGTADLKIGTAGGLYPQFANYDGCEITIVTKSYPMDDVFTVKIINGYDKINEIKLDGTQTVIKPQSNGTHTINFCAAKDEILKFTPMNGFTPYSLTIDGEPATKKWSWDSYYTMSIKNGSVIEFQAYEESGPTTHEVSLQYRNKGKEALQSIFNRSLGKQLDIANNDKFDIEDGNILSLNFDEDYNLTTLTANGQTLTPYDNSATYKVTEPTTFIIDATPKVYSTKYVTAYISSPEGVEIYAGNRINGEKVEINIDNATPMTSDISLPSSDVDGPVTMKADKTYKFTLAMSTKYPTYNIYTKDGYWLQTARMSNTSKYADNPLSESTIYIAAKPVERTDKAIVYLQGPSDRITMTPSAIYGSDRKITFEYEGYTEVDFEAAYESPYTIRTGAIIDGMQVFLDGVAQSRDENDVFSDIPVKNNSVLKIFADGKTHSPKTVTFSVEDGATADVSYDRVLQHTDFSQSLQCYHGTEFAVTPGPKTDVLLNGEKLYPYEDGNCYFAVDETEPQHVVTLAYKGGDPRTYTVFPETGETVESLDAIRISFPYAESAFLSDKFDTSDIMLVKTDWSWAALNPEIERLEGADCPTFVVSFPTPPTSLGHYRFNIASGAFLLDGTTDSSEIAAEYDLYFEVSGDLEYLVDPAGDMIASEWGPMGAFLFDESLTVTDYSNIKAATTLEFDGTALTDDQYGFEIYYNMVMFGIYDAAYYNKPGTLHIHINAGAFKVNGQDSPEIDHTWNIIEPKSYTFQFSPDITSGEPIDIFEAIIVTIPEAETAFVDMANGISLRNSTYTYYQNAKIEPVETSTYAARSTGKSFKVTFNPMPTAAGQYTLSMNSTTFCCDGAQYPEAYSTTFNYTATTGVEDITVDAADDNTIYNLQGIRLDSEWNELPAGLYIRGGKKVLKH